jgi:hypothetical protein
MLAAGLAMMMMMTTGGAAVVCSGDKMNVPAFPLRIARVLNGR